MTTTRVCALVVTFNPCPKVLEKLAVMIGREVERIVIIDNTPGKGVEQWTMAYPGDGRFAVVSLRRNRGVAEAHNVGIRWARKHECSHVLLLDQDSVPGNGMVAKLMETWEELRKRRIKVAAVGPRYVDPRSGQTSLPIRFGLLGFRRIKCTGDGIGEVVRTDFLISSGALISLEALSEIGEMDEQLFIDHVDTEWLLRARSMGYQAFVACDSTMQHKLGERVFLFWFGRWRHVAVYRAPRLYYMFRNSILLYQRPYSPAVWIVYDMIRLIVLAGLYLTGVGSRRRNARAMFEGIRDGIRGIAGERYSSG